MNADGKRGLRKSEFGDGLTVVFEYTDDDWWIGYVEELPGANTQGRTLDEARENLREAIEMVVEAKRELAQRPPDGRCLGNVPSTC